VKYFNSEPQVQKANLGRPAPGVEFQMRLSVADGACLLFLLLLLFRVHYLGLVIFF
jgi:hypothetical protein